MEQLEEDQFRRLPDDVVLNIFNKLSDMEWLCRCLAVSRRFSSLIPRVQIVSIKTNIWTGSTETHQNPRPKFCFLEKFSKFLTNYFLRRPLRYFPNLALLPSSQLKNVSGLVFLSKLTQIQSLTIEIPSDFIDTNDNSVVKWGINITKKIDSVTVLYATSLSQTMGAEEGGDETPNAITRGEENHRVSLATQCVRDAVLWVGILCYVVENYPMLQRVTIIDPKRVGVTLCLGSEKLVECRNSFNLSKMNLLSKRVESWTREDWKVDYVPVLELPMSGYVMKGVTIVNFKMLADDYSEADTAMVDAFAEEQGVFSEAVAQILENHDS